MQFYFEPNEDPITVIQNAIDAAVAEALREADEGKLGLLSLAELRNLRAENEQLKARVAELEKSLRLLAYDRDAQVMKHLED